MPFTNVWTDEVLFESKLHRIGFDSHENFKTRQIHRIQVKIMKIDSGRLQLDEQYILVSTYRGVGTQGSIGQQDLLKFEETKFTDQTCYYLPALWGIQRLMQRLKKHFFTSMPQITYFDIQLCSARKMPNYSFEWRHMNTNGEQTM